MRMAFGNKEEWTQFDFREHFDLGVAPKYPKKIKLLADENIPMFIIEDLAQNFSTKSVFDLGLEGHPDENIREASKKEKRILFTTDKDFWDEKKHPIQKCSGIICTEAGPAEIEKLYSSLAKFYVSFAKEYPNHWWRYTKAYVKTDGFILRTIQWDGAIDETEYRYHNGKLMRRKIK
jgi:predicted nuclease of predicted toxin-antitoxin system